LYKNRDELDILTSSSSSLDQLMDADELRTFKDMIKTSSSIERLLGEDEVRRWRIPLENLQLGDVVGRGAFGVVVHGHLRHLTTMKQQPPSIVVVRESDSGLDTSTYGGSSGYHEFRSSVNTNSGEEFVKSGNSLSDENNNQYSNKSISVSTTVSSSNVAVKKLPDNATFKNFYDHFKELKLMLHVGQHPHIINLIGYSIENSSLYIVIDYAKLGNLKDYLRRWHQLKRGLGGGESSDKDDETDHDYIDFDGSSDDKLAELKDDYLMLYAYQIALGMEYLHSKKVSFTIDIHVFAQKTIHA
jgi:serine/threonine protein kinase